MCVKERAREKVCVRVSVCVRETEGGREGDGMRGRGKGRERAQSMILLSSHLAQLTISSVPAVPGLAVCMASS